MNKLLLSLLSASLLGGVLSANNSFMSSDYGADFQAMQKYLDTMVDTHLTRSKMANMVYPRVNVQDLNSSYVYEFDLAGIPKEDIKLSIDENNLLTLSGKKENKIEKKSDKYTTQEIFYGSFSRVIKLPDNVDQDKLETSYKNGILKLTIGKKELIKPKSKVLQIK